MQPDPITASATKSRAVQHYQALAAEAARLPRANPRPDLDDCAAINAAAERTARRAEAAIKLITALAIGVPMAWWIVEWLTCEGVC